ncbi:MAG: dienelactone hydrolase family protein [Candidatus Solibacter usitatus]|nr:dienelactone hydrolase family protein [Candidatus Solibacter usitatus]
MLGHTWRNEDNPNLRDPGFQQLLARGTEWAATGGVAAIPETEWRKKILSTLHSPDPLPALEVKQHGKFSVEKGTQAERFSYRTQLGMRVPAIVYAPSAAPQVRRPAIIVVNGHGGDKFSWYAMYTGMAYARLGAVVLTYDPLGEGERNAKLQSGTRAHDRVVQPEEMGRYMGGLMLTDVRQAVSYLASRPDVDATRIAAVGYSMGSFVLSVACAAETRLRACVLVGGGNLDGPGEYWDGSKPMCQGIPYRSLAFLGDRPAALYSLHALRGATLIYNGDADTVVNIPKKGQTYLEEVRRATIALSGKNEVFDIDFVKGTSHRPYFVTKPVAIWLHRYLHFSHADLEKIPVQRIAGWAREHNVEMDKLYATYDREGGTPALFNDIPALTRAQLRVFSEKDWQAARGELIYESWVEKARLRLTPPPSSRTGSTPER